SDGAGGPPAQRAGGLALAAGRGAVCTAATSASWPEGSAPSPRGPLAGPVAADRWASALDGPARGAVRARRLAADLHAGCAVVRRATRAARAHRGGARPQPTTPR